MRLKEGNKEKDIIDSAIRVFAEKGFHNSRISEIAKQAGIAAGSVYLYFRDKDEILLKILELQWQRLLFHSTLVAERNDLDSYDKLDLFMEEIFRILSASPQESIVFITEQQNLTPEHQKLIARYYDKFLDIGAKILHEGQKEDSFDKKLSAMYFKNFIFGGTRYLLNQWALTPDRFPLNELKKQVKTFVRKGLSV